MPFPGPCPHPQYRAYHQSAYKHQTLLTAHIARLFYQTPALLYLPGSFWIHLPQNHENTGTRWRIAAGPWFPHIFRIDKSNTPMIEDMRWNRWCKYHSWSLCGKNWQYLPSQQYAAIHQRTGTLGVFSIAANNINTYLSFSHCNPYITFDNYPVLCDRLYSKAWYGLLPFH